AGGRLRAPAREGAMGPAAGRRVGGQERIVDAVEHLDVAPVVDDQVAGALRRADGRDDGVADILPGGRELHEVGQAAVDSGADQEVPGGNKAVFQLLQLRPAGAVERASPAAEQGGEQRLHRNLRGGGDAAWGTRRRGGRPAVWSW